MWIAGAPTQTEAGDSSEPSLLVVTCPVLLTSPPDSSQSPPVVLSVVEVMCTVNVELSFVVPAGTVTEPQVRTPCGLIEQGEPQPVPWPAITQFRPGLAGSWSVRVTPFASPSPSFQTVIVKPI